MKNTKHLLLLVLLTVLIISCKKKEIFTGTETNSIHEKSAYLAKLEFGKALSVSLNNREIRDLIKKEALKQFDKDYDVLFNNIIDLKLSNGETVLEYIISKSENPVELANNIKQLPLLNIFVPDLKSFSANDWDVDKQVPVVAVLRETDKKEGVKEIYAFDADGKTLKLSYSILPTIPVIVVKDNERVEVSNGVSKDNSKIAISNRDYKYNFISTEFNNTSKQAKLSKPEIAEDRGGRGGTGGDPVIPIDNSQQITDLGLRYAYEQKLNSQRDYIYYGIDSTKNLTTGTFNGQYAEHIVSIRMENQAALDKITDNWTEGNLEIVINIIIINSSGAPLSIKKVINCSASDLNKINRDGSIAGPLAEFSGFNPIEIDSWDAYKYGDKWKFVVSEYDPGTETTTTQSSTSTFTSNFNESISVDFKIIKIGAGGGGSSTDTKTSTISIKTTDTSDDLYEGFLNFYRPVYSRKTETTSIRGVVSTYIVPNPYLVSTGAINIKVLPIRVQ